MSTNWKEFRDTLGLSPEEEKMIDLEKSLIAAVVNAREESGLTQNQVNN